MFRIALLLCLAGPALADTVTVTITPKAVTVTPPSQQLSLPGQVVTVPGKPFSLTLPPFTVSVPQTPATDLTDVLARLGALEAQVKSLQPAGPPAGPPPPPSGAMPVLTVGPGQQYASIGAAMDALSTVAQAAGLQYGSLRGIIRVLPVPSNPLYYANDYVPPHKPWGLGFTAGTDLTLEALPLPDGTKSLVYLPYDVGQLEYSKAPFDVPGPGKFTLRGFKIDGKAPYGNIAAIRVEGTGLDILIEDCEFLNNGNGILETTSGGSLTMNRTWLHNNGDGTGQTHNAYIGQVTNVTLNNVLSTSANVGHLFKTRSYNLTVNGSRFFDLDSGTASYGIDVPEGGVLTINDSIIQRGPKASNGPAIAFSEEIITDACPGVDTPGKPRCYVPDDKRPRSISLNNVMILSSTPSDTAFLGTLGMWNALGSPVTAVGTKFFGPGPRLIQMNGPTGTVAWPGDVTMLPTMPDLDTTPPMFH